MLAATHPSCSPPDLSGRALATQSLGTLTLCKQLSRGAHGIVYHAKSASQSRSFAVKHVLSSHLTPKQRIIQRKEAEFHSRCSGWIPECQQPVLDFVNPFVEACMAAKDSDGWFLITEYWPDGDLFSRLPEFPKVMPELEAARLFLQLLSTVAGFHERGIYHRDLKPENILVSVDDPEHPDQLSLRLTDFGMATDKRIARERGCGSVIYMAPETLQAMRTPASQLPPILDAEKQDAWSCAQLAVNLFLSVNAWHLADLGQDKCYAFFRKNPHVNLMRFLRISQEFNDILIRAFDESVDQRLSVLEMWREVDKMVNSNTPFTISEAEFEKRKQRIREAERASKAGRSKQRPTIILRTDEQDEGIDSGNEDDQTVVDASEQADRSNNKGQYWLPNSDLASPISY